MSLATTDAAPARGWQARADGRRPSAVRPRVRGGADRHTTAGDAARVHERALVARAQAGEQAAFEELVRRYADRLYAVVVRFVADAGEAEEVTQEAFLRAWRSISRFEGRAQFFTWLYRIAINEAKRRAERRRSAEQAVPFTEQAIEQAADACEAPDPGAEQAELRGALERAVRALPLEHRTPLILRDIEGLSTREAAQVMELPEAAFKSRLHRARIAVRAAIDDYLEEDGR